MAILYPAPSSSASRIVAWIIVTLGITLSACHKSAGTTTPPVEPTVHPELLRIEYGRLVNVYGLQQTAEGSTIVLFDYDSDTGKLSSRQTISTLPKGFAGSNFCSEILVSEDGRFVYAGNRLHDSIGVFSVSSSGELKHVADEWTRGNYPRSFSFDPTGNFLYCGNQRADHLTVFKVDKKTGELDFTGERQPLVHSITGREDSRW